MSIEKLQEIPDLVEMERDVLAGALEHAADSFHEMAKRIQQGEKLTPFEERYVKTVFVTEVDFVLISLRDALESKDLEEINSAVASLAELTGDSGTALRNLIQHYGSAEQLETLDALQRQANEANF